MGCLDLNDVVLAEPQSTGLDLNEVESFLDYQEFYDRVHAEARHWVPVLYPHGRLSADRREYRLADPSGRAPGKQGSFVITLSGPGAGTGYEYDPRNNKRYTATEMVEAARPGEDATGWLAAQVGMDVHAGYSPAPRAASSPIPPIPAPAPRGPDRYKGDVALLLSKCAPAKGSPVEDYFKSRGIPLPETDDLKYCADITDHAAKRGYQGMVAIVRAPDGTPMKGVHRTMLHDDFRADDKAKHKKMLAEVAGGAVRLADMGDDGRLAISEGVETGAAAMWLYGEPTWATLSTTGMVKFDASRVPGLKFLTIYTDAGDAGLEAAHAAANAARMAGIPGEIVRPVGDDDFAKDVKDGERPGLTRADSQVVHRWEGTAQVTSCEVFSPSSLESLRSAVASVRHSDTKAVSAILRDVAATAGLTAGEVGNLLRGLKEVSGLQMGELRAELDGHKRALARMNSKFSDLPVLAEDGSPKPVFANAAEMLRSNDKLANVLSFNEFAGVPFARSLPPWDATSKPRPWTDDDDHRLHEWFDLFGLHVPLKTVQQATEMVSRERRYHPVRDYLNGLRWDGVDRLTTWLTDCLGVSATDYTRAVGRAWMISAVARIFKPGCKADYALIFEGAQGLQKSTAARILGGDWFTDDLADLGTKDSALQMQGVWIVEIAELAAMGRKSVDIIKSFIARQEDRFRSPYEKRVMPHPRQCVFVGTVNPGSNGYLTDETGNRRFWPVEITKVDEGKLADIRDQLWAEAVAAYRKGEKWWITESEILADAESEQQARMQDDPWSEAVINYALACGQKHVTVAEILTSSAFSFDVKELEQKHLTRVAKILKRNGWKRVQIGNPKKWAYERPISPQSPVGTTSEPVS